MGLLDRARAAYAAGKAEQASKEAAAVEAKKMQEKSEKVVRAYKERETRLEEQRNPSPVGRLAGRAGHYIEKGVAVGAHYGGRLSSELETMGKAQREAAEKRAKSPRKEGFGRVVPRHPVPETQRFFGGRGHRRESEDEPRDRRGGARGAAKPRRKSMSDFDMDDVFRL